MKAATQSRRAFLFTAARTAAGGALGITTLTTLADCTRDDRGDAVTGRVTRLTAAEERSMRALATCILPSEDGRPGAAEADAVTFITRAMQRPGFADTTRVLRVGLADLDARAVALGARRGFADLAAARQSALLHEVEDTPFFTTARTLVVVGTFADPRHGGNRGRAGWQLADMEPRDHYQAPFGWYDAPRNETTSDR